MPLRILPSLRSLEGSEELSTLESGLMEERAGTLSELRRLEDDAELVTLSRSLTFNSSPTAMEILEEFERLDRNDEHLHSRFLEFLLNPQEQRHGLSDAFLKALLRKTKFFRRGTPAEQLLCDGDFCDTKVIREAVSEQGRADLKLTNSRQKFVFLVENKTLSPERNRQLARYWEDAEKEEPSFAIGGLFITPDGRPPTTGGKYEYGAVSYGEVAELLDECTGLRGNDGPAVDVVRQYASAIRRWFVEDPEKKKLAWRIYRKFPAAAAYLSTDRVKPLWQISEGLQDLVTKAPSGFETVLGSPNTKEVELWFVPRDWDKIPELRNAGIAKEERTDGRLLVFWFYCWPESEHAGERQLSMCLGAAPGADGEDVRKLIGTIAKQVPSFFPGIEIHEEPEPQRKWTNLWSRRILSEEQLNELNRDVVFKLIGEGWRQFVDGDFPKINAAIAALFSRKSPARTSA